MKKAINIIIAALVLLCVVSSMATIITGGGNVLCIVIDAVKVAVAVLVLCYNFFGYKKPHGNLLRYTFLIFGFTTIVCVFLVGNIELGGLIRIVAGTLVVYMSGRLNKIEKNKILAIVVLALFVAIVIMNVFRLEISFEAVQSVAEEVPTMDPSFEPQMSALSILGICANPFVWLALALAYTSRYAAHKEAGLEDKPKA